MPQPCQYLVCTQIRRMKLRNCNHKTLQSKTGALTRSDSSCTSQSAFDTLLNPTGLYSSDMYSTPTIGSIAVASASSIFVAAATNPGLLLGPVHGPRTSIWLHSAVRVGLGTWKRSCMYLISLTTSPAFVAPSRSTLF